MKSKENPKKEPKKGAKTQEAQEVKKRKLRLLCIHGYRQSAKTAREKLGSFRKLVGKVADLDFITAPHLIPSDKEEEQGQFGWWFSQTSHTFNAHEETDCDLGFKESLELITETLRCQCQNYVSCLCHHYIYFNTTITERLHIPGLHMTGYFHSPRELPSQLTTASSNTRANWT